MKVVVVVDVFRAFTTASYILEQKPQCYALTVRQSVVTELALKHLNAVIIGKSEKGMDNSLYRIPNSPTRVLEIDVKSRSVIHRTQAGAMGVLAASDADKIFAAGFVNAKATVRYVKALGLDSDVTIKPMGHEGTTPSLEDNLCAQYIQNMMANKKFDLQPYLNELKEGPGSYFFGPDQWQYPSADFDRCLELDRFDFAIEAILGGDYALLHRRDTPERDLRDSLKHLDD